MPLCCTENPGPGPRPVHDPVPVVTQYATADLISDIAYEGHDSRDDSAWRTTGAPTQAAYGRWCRHMCGVACLRMVLLHRDGNAATLFELLAGVRRYGAYVRQDDGSIKGLIYTPFVRYVETSHNLPAVVHPNLGLNELATLLDDGLMVMASVSKEIRRPERDPERRGGHLVLAIGRLPDGQVVFRNPSGHTTEARAAVMPLDRFGAFFGGRGISLDPRSSVRHAPARARAIRPVASRPTT
ncbi:peptidase [Streptomyces sp. NPDC059787]|uniref:peptidase n=1 Tax=Streptomyces sp. NPDC059787 TaxID=3346947 RepID=UPI003648CF42